jgi:hypothetical protein
MPGLTKRATPDRSKIEVDDAKQLKYWLKALDVSKEDLLRSLPGVSLGTRVDMVASRAPIRRHWLAAVGTWRADRGRWNGPQTSTSSGRISARLPCRDSKRPPRETAGNRNDQAEEHLTIAFGEMPPSPPRNERPWLLIRFPTAASP